MPRGIGSHHKQCFELRAAQYLIIDHACLLGWLIARQGVWQKSHIARAQRVGILKEWTNPSSGTINITCNYRESLEIGSQFFASCLKCSHLIVKNDRALRFRDLVGQFAQLSSDLFSQRLFMAALNR